ncbi:hypothetical protein [Azospirillum thermophilum]|uniref:Uncharacterized protein n=1 Tax=Azospirillum thermophilum TaxID=2202148 RepID=A0A2S2CXE6_9PROT|nr:hypothetical protein [Azospirillum thermophilum]AWK89161.1 hypothetical protein DEW08_24555 [Azospirillum thermophilum]
MPYDPLMMSLKIVDTAIVTEEERGLPEGALIAALFTATAATLLHHFGWSAETLASAVAEMAGNEEDGAAATAAAEVARRWLPALLQ